MAAIAIIRLYQWLQVLLRFYDSDIVTLYSPQLPIVEMIAWIGSLIYHIMQCVVVVPNVKGKKPQSKLLHYSISLYIGDFKKNLDQSFFFDYSIYIRACGVVE
jgi:hypothetical protein